MKEGQLADQCRGSSVDPANGPEAQPGMSTEGERDPEFLSGPPSAGWGDSHHLGIRRLAHCAHGTIALTLGVLLSLCVKWVGLEGLRGPISSAYIPGASPPNSRGPHPHSPCM